MFNKPSKIISIVLCSLLLFEQSGFAQVSGQLDLSGYITGLKSAFSQDKYRPLHLRYLGYDTKSSDFKLLLDKGDFLSGHGVQGSGDREQNTVGTGRDLSVIKSDNVGDGFNYPDNILKEETNKLLEYFFIGLSLPNESFWVNLRPDSPNNTIDSELAKTDIGKILLESDVQLKKDTALYTSPQTKEGKAYWDKLYKKAEELYGYDNITIPTLTRPWIVPGEIIVRETRDEGRGTILSAYVYKAVLKVMLEEDYLSGDGGQGSGNRRQKIVGEGLASSHNQNTNKSYEFKDPRVKELNTYSTQLIKELIIPKLTKEINTSKRYAKLRQVYYSLILAQWFKARFHSQITETREQKTEKSVGTGRDLSDNSYKDIINSSNLTGLTSKQAWSKDTYYRDYQKSFKDGEYNLKEPVRTPYGQSIRSYFSGGIGFGGEIASAVSSGIIQGRPDIIPEQIFSQTAVSLVLNNYIIPAAFEAGGLKMSSPIDTELDRRIFNIGRKQADIVTALSSSSVRQDSILLDDIDKTDRNQVSSSMEGKPVELGDLEKVEGLMLKEGYWVVSNNKYPGLGMGKVISIEPVTNPGTKTRVFKIKIGFEAGERLFEV
ncbi:MAG: hypothetical protein ABIH18_01850, partial [Candidatus Omnitrophota bacterium]